MNTVYRLSAFYFSLLFSLVAFSAENATDFKIDLPGHAQIITLKDLMKKLKITSVKVKDPVYKAEKTYEGFFLSDVFKLAGVSIQNSAFDEVIFHCVDGYSPTMKFSDYSSSLQNQGSQNQSRAFLAIREKGYPKKGSPALWQSFKQGKAEMTPAPYYLVWEKSATSADDSEKRPWPYQVVGIELIQFKEKFNRIYPVGASEDSKVFQGFMKFKSDCLRCHSVNLQGGVIGPELNVPKNITEYWDGKVLKDFIKNSGDFRAKSKMPSFSHWKEEEIDSTIEYLKWMKEHKNLQE